MLELLLLVVVAALVFDFINGFHDAANAIATSVATGVMTVGRAVVISGIFNFFGALAGTAVAGFIASGIADPKDPLIVTQAVVLAALIGASVWNLLTWWWGIPSSSSHALVGGICGAVIANAGWDKVLWGGVAQKVLIPLVVSPVAGFLVALVLMILCMWVFRSTRPALVNGGAKLMQLVSACTLSFAHGMNDAQKVMGVITMALVAWMAGMGLKPVVVDRPDATAQAAVQEERIQASAMPEFVKEHHAALLPTAHTAKDGKERNDVPLWVVLACATAMCLGTMAGGRRIIRTLGTKISRLQPLQGFAAQTAGTGTIMAASVMGMPVSTTHCITASVLGAGTSRGLAAVRWGVAGRILVAWVLTLPASAGMAWACMIGLRAWLGPAH
ncbi:MAG: hypothetical protein RLZZ127_1591 [Planctomycetota bacterium]|jgi:PiT family inorganic phosphate transporter